MTSDTNGTPSHVTNSERATALLEQFDQLVGELDAAIGEANAARLVISDAETEMAIIEASLTLVIEGRNDTERKARLTLALREDAGYQSQA